MAAGSPAPRPSTSTPTSRTCTSTSTRRRCDVDASVARRAVALVPARAGSKRLPGKNVRMLAGHPLHAYTISAAIRRGVFDAVVLATDIDAYAAVGRHYGAEVPFLRP